MAGPNSTSFQRPDLGRAFDEWDVMGASKGFIGLNVLPLIDVSLQSANLSVVPRRAYLDMADINTKRATGARSNRNDFEFEQINYACEEHSFEQGVDDRQRNIFAYTGVDIEMVAARRLVYGLLLEHEIAVAAAVNNTSTFTADDVGTEWSTGATCTPITDVLDGISTFKAQCGLLPTHIVFSDKVLRNLQVAAEVVDRIKYSGTNPEDARRVTRQALSEIWGIQVLVSEGPGTVKGTSQEGETLAIGDIWDDEYAFMFHQMDTSMMGPGLGATVHYVGDGSSVGPTIDQYRAEDVRGDVIRGRMDYHVKLIDTQCGLLLGNITA